MTTHPVAASIAVVILLAAAHAQTNNPDQMERFEYVLTMNKVRKLDAVKKSLDELSRKHPDVNETNEKTMDDMARKFEKYPDVMAVLARTGVTPREYAVGLLTLMQAGLAVSLKKSGGSHEYPPEILKLVSKANLEFIEQNWDTIQKMAARPSRDQ
jgi:hypothetical protein